LAEAEAGRLPLLLPVPDWPLASPGPPHLHCICIASKICFAGESGGLDGFNFRLLETRLDAFRSRAPRANDFIPELGTVCPGTNPVCFVTVCGKTARRTIKHAWYKRQDSQVTLRWPSGGHCRGGGL
jgi:hypothetical protein